MTWSEILPHPSTGLITGRRGSGKTALGMYLLEHLGGTYGLPAYSMGLPREKWGLLPPEIKGLEFGEDPPEHSVTFIDEAAMAFYARKSMSELNKLMNILISISRQRDQTLIFASHTARKLDVGIVLDMDALVWKEPSKLYARFERQEIREMAQHALGAFEGIEKENRPKYSAVFSHDVYGELMVNPLPSFWSEDLSRGFAGVPLAVEREETKELSEQDKRVLHMILDVEDRGDYYKELGWEQAQVGGSWQQLMHFISLGLIRQVFKSGSHRGFRADIERVKKVLATM